MTLSPGSDANLQVHSQSTPAPAIAINKSSHLSRGASCLEEWVSEKLLGSCSLLGVLH